MNIKITQTTGLHMRLTPQLIVLMRLMALPSFELQQEVAKALEENPLLEEDTTADGTETLRLDDAAKLLEYLSGGPAGPARGAAEPEVDEERRRPELADSMDRDLRGHLLEQLHQEILDPHLLPIGEWIIENLDERGFLDKDCLVIALHLGAENAEVMAVLDRIHHFDPVGTAARDSQECLLIQARAYFPGRQHLARLIEEYLPALKERRYPAIARGLGISIPDVIDEEARLLTLNPIPARGFGGSDAATVMPDVHVIQVDGELVVRVNDDGQPKLRISRAFRKTLQDKAANPEVRAYIQSRLNAAKWFVRAVYERQRTIHKVTESIVRFQRAFFEKGPEHLRALTLRDVADEVGVAESTVSRATKGKYVSTPRGVFELKYFFSSGVSTSDGMGEVAARSVRETIRRIIADEAPSRPLSDQEIVAHLQQSGVAIARRTVAKYREELGLGSSTERRHQRCSPKRGRGGSDERPGIPVAAPILGEARIVGESLHADE
jgi:RNA polymerase sigma-54 factor